MRKKLWGFIALFGLIFLMACNSELTNESGSNDATASDGENEEAVTFRLGHVTQTSHPYHMAAEHFAELVHEKTGGTINFEIYPARQLGGDLDMLEMIQNGSLDAGLITSGVFSGSTPVMDGLQLPFLIDSYETFGKAVESETAQKMLDSLESLGLKGLGINESGMRQLGSNVSEIQSPEDFKGLKIRVVESPLMLDIFNSLGASPTPMPYGEIYSSLQTGVIDAHEANLPAYNDENFYEVTEYITLTNHFPFPNINVMNLATFQSLTEEQQTALQEAGKETSLWIVEQLVEVDNGSLETLRESGQNIAELENVEPFIEMVTPIYEQYAEKDPLIAEFIETVNQIKNQ
ncbi:TRAP transporter substrate-binding protein [Halalkalibacterium ligniniphilum]|uniref:TRAP transporter substrate-binding protein n=1 Tax=Halalkalibacterium ligniniphilum TaxID=1134413 RepID=UPI0003459571|nr:TRAP transporter substrate-binding protein [Halalkalibacterium ligniniphilum]